MISSNRRPDVSVMLRILIPLLALCLFSSSLQARRYAAIVIEADSGRVLHEANADQRNYPASLTKMMTLYMVFEALEKKEVRMDTRWKVSRYASRKPPSKLGLRPGQTVSVKNSILALVTKSANDVASVVAENLGGSEAGFARQMTKRARQLGMKSTTFRNASGLPDGGQKTTARDMSKLGQALMRDFPQYYYFFSTRKFRYGKRVYKNHNKLLLSYGGTDGIKTGYIRASGFNLVASTVRNGTRLIGVVMGGKTSASRNRQMKTLLDNGFARVASEPQTRVASEYKPSLVPASFAHTSTGTLAEQVRPKVLEINAGTAPGTPANWAIQVGAFSFFKPAKSAADQAKKAAPLLLGTSQVTISPYKDSNKVIYRARLTGIVKDDARKACKVLLRLKMACITVPPPRKIAYESRSR